ncbi:MAG: hypothetical protein FJ014_13585 [Chloroflexi bacterium]|nr:hypothetical protein [Chloroflexota bacterium]
MRTRVLDIYAKYGEYIKAIVPLKIEAAREQAAFFRDLLGRCDESDSISIVHIARLRWRSKRGAGQHMASPS